MGTTTERVRATATQIKQALLKFYAPPSHRVFFEVSNDTGHKASRWIDAVAVGIWPSTGHEIVGIEIKVSRADWKRELESPAKAQALMRFCTRWYLACPEGLVARDEMPGTWGLLTYRDDGTMRQKIQAKRLDPEPLTPGFMMAVLRNASAVDMELVAGLVAEQVSTQTKRFEAEVERAVAQRVRDVGSRQQEALQVAEKIKAITGQDFRSWTVDIEALAGAYLFMKESRAHSAHGYGLDFPGIIRHLAQAQAALQAIHDNPSFADVRAVLSSRQKVGS